ncbi:MAG: hypothetical protein IJ396_07320 [Oscillibacter sp.]|nr:hypothetical protein [Oscillibacter sp.]
MSRMDELCAAVRASKEWLPGFSRREYPRVFAKYRETYGPRFAAAVRECDGDLVKLEQLANAFLDGMEAGWKAERFWNRSAARADQRHMLIVFLSPMLMEERDPMCSRLAGMLRQCWAERWPKDAYQLTTYEVIQNGFRNAIFGIDLAGKHLDPEKDRK